MRVKWLVHDVEQWLEDGGRRLIHAGDELDMPDEEARSRAASGQVELVKAPKAAVDPPAAATGSASS
jgi:hypothetical protein